MTDSTPASTPSALMAGLERLLGRWEVQGGATGTVTYEWMPGGFFLQQYVDLHQGGAHIEGLEIIGHLFNPFSGQPPSTDVKSRFYDNQGNTLDYVYELEGETLTIWAGEKGAPAHYRGIFSNDGNTLSGRWVYPGGGYDSTQTRL